MALQVRQGMNTYRIRFPHSVCSLAITFLGFAILSNSGAEDYLLKRCNWKSPIMPSLQKSNTHILGGIIVPPAMFLFLSRPVSNSSNEFSRVAD